MKIASGQTQVQQKSAPEVSKTAQNKKAFSDTLEFEDQRQSTQDQAALQTRIDQSPRMTAQRKQMVSAFSPTVQRKTSSLFPQTQGANTQNTLRRETAVQVSNTPSASVVQRDPGDEPIVEWMQTVGRLTKRGYKLLCEQVEIGKKQVMMLKFFADPVQGEDNSELAAAQENVNTTAAAFHDGIAGLPEEASDAHATAVALGQSASVSVAHTLLEQWSKESLAAMKIVSMAMAKASGMLVKVKEAAIKMAQVAMGAGEIIMMRGLLKVADDCYAATAAGDAVVAGLNSEGSVASSAKEKAGLVTTVSDATNNAVTGIGFGVLGALEAGGVFSLSTASVVLGVIGGVLGLFFGAIGVFLGVKNTIRAKQSIKKLKNAKSKVSNSELEAIAEYAIDQKEHKARRNTAAAVGGLAAIGAGAIGLVALSVATFGLAAIVAGIGAALIGLGILGYRIIRSWRKRKAERKAFADQLIAEIQSNGDDEAVARRIITGVGMDPANVAQPGFKKTLAGNLKGYIKSKRTRMAEGLVKSLIAGKPSEVFDSELILGALGVGPEWIKAQVDAEKANKAVSKVAGKLASW